MILAATLFLLLCCLAWRARAQFHLGLPILLMLVVSATGGVAILGRRARPRADLKLWVFAPDHAETYRSIAPMFEKQTGKTLDVELVGDAVNIRLASLFMAGRGGETLPDAAEIEIGHIGQFFRPPVNEIGFLPLNAYLENSGFREIQSLEDPGKQGWHARLAADGRIYQHNGRSWVFDPTHKRPDSWIDRLASSRLVPWSKNGQIFGVPHDVHPVSLTYRDDLFREAGIDLATATTWEQFQMLCLQFQHYWAGRGMPQRHALELPAASSDYLVVMLQQRHVDLVDDLGRVHINDGRVAQTVAFYAQLVAGANSIGASTATTTGIWLNDLEAGNICVVWTPDWKVDTIHAYGSAERLSGRLRMMPLPRFGPDDAPTGTWGGTMIGIPRSCPRPDEAWKLIEFLYLSKAGLAARQATTNIIPPLIDEWEDAAYLRPDPLFGGQRIQHLYTQLAQQIPPHQVTPVTTIAQIELSVVTSFAVDYVKRNGVAGLEAKCADWLGRCDRDMVRRVKHATFD